MDDFRKLFRRQRSVKTVHGEESFSDGIISNKNDNFNTRSSKENINASNNANTRASKIISTSEMSLHDEDRFEETFKEPTKGWRKSFRKLRWKKRDANTSVSTDDIAKSVSVENVDQLSPMKSPGKVNKRWSYSPDLCEDNVPGARELRGTLERKLSTKREVDETPYMKPKSARHFNYDHSPSKRGSGEYQMDTRNRDMSISSFNSTQDPSSYLAKGDAPTIPDSLDLKQASRFYAMSHLSQSQPISPLNENEPTVNNVRRSSSGIITQAEDNNNNSNHNQEYETPHQPGNLYAFQGYDHYGRPISTDETPEEDDIPYDLGDIDEVLANASRNATLQSLHGQNNSSTLPRYFSGTLMRGRAGTKFERDAEMVLENLDYNQQPVNHYYQHLNDHDDRKLKYEDLSDDLRTDTSEENEIPIPDDNISWGSNEFDASSSEDDEEDRFDFSFSKKKKNDRASKDVQKFKFWERTSVKKKNSIQKAEIEPSLFVDVDLPTTRHPLPHLPPLVPPDLTPSQLKRRKIVATIISSEQSYIESLQRLETDYKQALFDSKPPIISSETIVKIFYKISEILQCHRLFQIALSAATSDWDEHECIGETFVASFSKSMVLECYGDFINNFTTAMDTVRKTCIRKPQFLAFLRERQAESPNKLNLYGLMLKPVQRFPQFIMLVQDLLKNTSVEHRDRLQLQLALTELETLADRLNHHKAREEGNSDLRTLLENSNLKLTTQTKDGRTRWTIKQGDVRECESNDNGMLEKVKDCLLVLTNDMLICCSINNSYSDCNLYERRLSGTKLSQLSPGAMFGVFHSTFRQISSNLRRPQRAAVGTSKDMYKLKWRVGLDTVEVMDGSECPTNKTNRETMTQDFILLQEISRLVEGLKLEHEGLSGSVVDKCMTELEVRIRQAEQLARQPEDTSFTVRFPGKSGEFVTRTLVHSYESHKAEWLEAIARAKLANSPSNLGSWFCSANTEIDAIWDPPLFLRSLSAPVSNDRLQVQSAYAFMSKSHETLLWMSCAASTVLSVVSVYCITEDRVEKVHVMQVESSVQCMEHWNPFEEGFSVWLGMESGCLLEYSSAGHYTKLSEVVMPTMSTVMIMKAHKNSLYVGLLDGTLAMYSRPKGTLELSHLSSIMVGTGPLVCLSPVGDKLWGCSGNNVVTIDIDKFETESSRTLLLDGEQLTVNLVVRVGSGLWVTFNDECNLNLYHLESLQRLQELNLSRIIRDFVQGLDASERISEHCHITSLYSCHSQLLVGTSNGLLLAMPLPKLPGSVPKITGPCKVCQHSLQSPLNFLFSPNLPPVPPRRQISENSPPPVPKRDDLDKTLVPEDMENKNFDSEKIEKSFLQTNGPISPLRRYSPNPLSPTSQTTTGSPIIPPRPKSTYRSSPLNPSRPTSINNPTTSRPASTIFFPPVMKSNGSKVTEMTPEDGRLYEKMELQSIESPRKLTFVHWKEKSTRDCKVILACGEGYRRLGSKNKQNSNKANLYTPTIICWKVVS